MAGALVGGALAFRPALRPLQAAGSEMGSVARLAVLTDLTRCIGCRACEVACNRVNNLPPPEVPFSDTTPFDKERRPTANAFTVVNRYATSNGSGPVFRKVQCMHCNEPACVSVCPVAAMIKTPEGPVIWDEKVCIGCRYCMVACPFYMPAYEYSSPFSPRVRKCTMCYERVFKKGGNPACVEACPTKAITFGKRDDLLRVAHKRMAETPDRYVSHIYGENEAGGTSWLYLSPVPFEEVGLPKVGNESYGRLTLDFLTAVPVVLILWPLALIGVHWFGRRRERTAADEALRKAAGRTQSKGEQP